MRISTNTIFERGLAQLQQQQTDLFRTQQQISTGRRILNPADDPIGAARALEIRQSQSINTQFTTNQGAAEDNLRLVESRLSGITDLLQLARETALEAGGGTLSQTERNVIATELRAQFDTLLSLGNSQDATGEFLFAGFRSQTQPFTGDLAGVNYAGDQGQRTIQVSGSRFMPVSVPGSELFTTTRTVDDSSISVAAASGNSAGASLSVTFAPPAPPVDPSFTGRRYEVAFNAGDFTVTERSPGGGLTTTVVPGPAPITINGLTIDAPGALSDGDAFEVFVPSQNVFQNLALFIDSLERPGPAPVGAGAVAFGVQGIDAGLDSILRARTTVGSQLVEIDNLRVFGGDLEQQLTETLSRVEDVDLTEAISRLTRQQTFLEAAQQSFLRVSNLSLFNFLN